MKLKDLKKHLDSKKGSTEEYPFGPDAMVYKVAGKMFALVALDEDPLYVSIKLHPDDNQMLRASFKSVEPAYHFNKEHWSSVTFEGDVSDAMALSLIDDSYNLVASKLKKADREKLNRM